MISHIKAKEIIEKEFPDRAIEDIYDLKDRWVLYFDMGDPQPPGIYAIAVNKENGKIMEVDIDSSNPLDEEAMKIEKSPIVYSKNKNI